MAYFGAQPSSMFEEDPSQNPGYFGQGFMGRARGAAGRLGRGLAPYSNRLLMASMGLLSGTGPNDGWANAAKGFAVGSELDQEKADRTKAERDDAAFNAAIGGLDDNLYGPYKDLMKSDRGLARMAIGSQFGQKDRRQWHRLNDGTLYDPDTGETRRIDAGDEQGGALFEGKGLDAQALNQLVQNGSLTPQQALEVAAGKTITGPNGETLFATPSQLAGGGGEGQEEGRPNALTGPKLTEDQRKVSGFARRAAVSDEIMSQDSITAAGQSATERMKGAVPAVGNYLVSEDYQKFDQAQRDFINAILRRESGAVISPEEFENARIQYFPQPGDGPDVLRQKAANRRLAVQSLMESAAPSPTYGGSAPPSNRGGSTSTGTGWEIVE